MGQWKALAACDSARFHTFTKDVFVRADVFAVHGNMLRAIFEV